jgi:hypothetical protein
MGERVCRIEGGQRGPNFRKNGKEDRGGRRRWMEEERMNVRKFMGGSSKNSRHIEGGEGATILRGMGGMGRWGGRRE